MTLSIPEISKKMVNCVIADEVNLASKKTEFFSYNVTNEQPSLVKKIYSNNELQKSNSEFLKVLEV